MLSFFVNNASDGDPSKALSAIDVTDYGISWLFSDWSLKENSSIISTEEVTIIVWSFL